MAAIEYSPTLYGTCLVLTKEEALRIKPLVLKAYAKEREKMDEYQGRVDGGYATKLEETLLIKHEESMLDFKKIADEIEHLINY